MKFACRLGASRLRKRGRGEAAADNRFLIFLLRVSVGFRDSA